ncbi:MAG: ATP-binding protein [Acidimicrobiales bacterium]
MTPATNRRLFFAGLALVVTSAIVTLAQHRVYEIPLLLAYGAYVVVGGLIVARRPGNTIGLALVAYAAIGSLGIAAIITAETLDEAGHLDAAAWVTLFASVVSPAQIALLAATWLLFPDGRPATAADRTLLRGTGVCIVALTVIGILASPQALPETKAYPHPFLDEDLALAIYDVYTLAFLILFFFGIFVAVRLIRRMRHGDPIERHQVLWVAVAVILNITVLIGNAFIQPLGTDDRAFWLIDAVAITLIPLGIGVAIFRYRLYDIDTIVSRSVTFGALALFIGGVYIAIVVGVGEFLGGEAGFGLSIVASVLVAMAFQPMRRRVERWANRLVYGERATPYEVLARFSSRSAELSDQELLQRVPRLIADGTGAATATLWTRSGDGFQMVANWPEEEETRHLADNQNFSDPRADHSLPVFHDGELLGGISLVKAGGETVTASEQALLVDLASGLGLALRNTRLTGALRHQVTELESSRERVLAASDDARRALERDLDSGPQQQLVALKVMLGPIRVLADRAGAQKTAGLVATLESDAGDAIAAVRDFAGGIYPPLLEAEGLAAAIGHQTRTAAVPVHVSDGRVPRLPRDIEAAVYFSVLEALQNTAKYADATQATVTLTTRGGMLTFEVRDDGSGFDSESVAAGVGLTGMADRLDTVGGQVTIESTPGEGTTVLGKIPTGDLASV